MNKVNCITINTDASFNHNYKVGGYAFYIVCDYFKIQKSGEFLKGEPKNPMQAEMMCIANAVSMLNFQKKLPESRLIIINSDCLYCFDRIGNNSKDKIGRFIARELKKLKKKIGFEKYELRHVKAHNGTPDARSYINDWCDKEARKWMRKKVRKLKKKEDETRRNKNN